MRVATECEFDCSTCGDVRIFEQPPCWDGHGGDCPEWACTACGTALLLDPVPEPVTEPTAALIAGPVTAAAVPRARSVQAA